MCPPPVLIGLIRTLSKLQHLYYIGHLFHDPDKKNIVEIFADISGAQSRAGQERCHSYTSQVPQPATRRGTCLLLRLIFCMCNVVLKLDNEG